MWSGLLPPGMNESDIELSSEDETTLKISKLSSKEDKGDGVTEEVGFSVFRTGGSKNEAETNAKNADEECPSGVPRNMWNKFQELHKKHSELKTLSISTSKRSKRKRSRKGKLKNKEESDSQQSSNEAQWKELTQYFGINDKFDPLISNRALLKMEIWNMGAAADQWNTENLYTIFSTYVISTIFCFFKNIIKSSSF
uniref:Protein FAM204A isoform X2 n=1 Tax=Phascolarctos cinereus TaxID=38626 RepID=A0A6P5KE82_PHACI|nr:protein FAM204A isoform X2 [Phascolarctos cinereus]